MCVIKKVHQATFVSLSFFASLKFASLCILTDSLAYCSDNNILLLSMSMSIVNIVTMAKSMPPPCMQTIRLSVTDIFVGKNQKMEPIAFRVCLSFHKTHQICILSMSRKCFGLFVFLHISILYSDRRFIALRLTSFLVLFSYRVLVFHLSCYTA